MEGVAMKVLVTGTDGYIGSLLAPYLVARGHDVTGLDTGYYVDEPLYEVEKRVPTIEKDLRRIEAADVAGYDAIVHLAELSNDPAGELVPHITYEINHEGSVQLAKLAREAGVRKFVYTSSCSVYGVAGDEDVTEESPTDPRTAYAVCKTLVERDVRKLASEDFSPTFLRNATAFGASPRMRFDLVVNNLAGLAWTTGKIAMTSDGTPWRPLVHALDISKAVGCVLAAPREAVHNQILNVGDTRQNYRVREIATIIGEVFPNCTVTFGAASTDVRSYRVSFDKIHEHLPDFSCEWDVRRGAEQLCRVFEQVRMTPETFNAPQFTRLAQLRRLRDTSKIDEHFYWVA
jgi:nucleoside-diphosphate-sugar epimerase